MKNFTVEFIFFENKKKQTTSSGGFLSQKKISAFILLLFLIIAQSALAQTTLIDPATAGGFEQGTTLSLNGWTEVNGTQTNKWMVGTATKYAGSNSAYVSNNNSLNQFSSNNNTGSTSHFYRDIVVPPNQTNITLSFYVKSNIEQNLDWGSLNFFDLITYGLLYILYGGDNDSFIEFLDSQGIDYSDWISMSDRLLVYTSPVTVTPVAGAPASPSSTLTGATLIYSQNINYSAYTLITIPLNVNLSGTTVRLIFTWQNDYGTENQPPASVDNISLVSFAPGDYRSIQNGNWKDASTWEKSTDGGLNWTAATTAPTIKDKVTVQSPHTVTIESGTASQALSLTVNGMLINRESITTTGAIVFNGGSTYQHDRNGGIIPDATWNLSSNCIITGITTSAPAAFQLSLVQSFGNFQWNCVSQNADVSLDGKLTDVRSDLTISGTGTKSVALGGAVGNLTVGGNFTQTNGNFIVSNSAARTMSVAGDFSLSGGTCNLSSGNNNTIVNVAQNFSFTGGILTESGTSTNSIVNFNGTDVQTFVSGGTLQYIVNFAILSGAIVDFGTSVISAGSSGSFILNNGGSIKTANPGGITTSGAAGSIQLTGTRTYSDGANYEYNGTSPQNTGSGLAQNKPGMVVISNHINSNFDGGGNVIAKNGVTFTENTTMDYLAIESGSFVNLGDVNQVNPSNGDHYATGLFLGENAYDEGRFGGAGSEWLPPEYIRTDYFGSNTGILTLTSGTSTTYSVTTNLTIDCGIESIDVEVWGGGGAGATRSSNGQGGGGGGGAYSRKENISITAGEKYIITVGGGANQGNAYGADSYFTKNTSPQPLPAPLVLAKGGNSALLNTQTGAAGGSASAGIGDFKFSGGNGANGNSSYGGGGGGSSAGSAANGSNANQRIGGIAPTDGGKGGDGKNASSSGNGNPGSSPGGGAGGANKNNGNSRNGGKGGDGQAIITYHYNPAIMPGAIQPVCQGITSVSLPYSLTNCLIPDKYIIIYSNEAQAAGFVNVILEPLTGSPIALTVPADASAGSYQGSIIGWDKETNSFGNPQPITVTINESIWTGLTDTDWNKPGNWSCNLVPTKYSNVTIPVVANLPVIELTSGTYPVAECKSITINSGAKLTIKGSLTVYNKMNNNAGVDGLIIKSGEGVANVPNGSLIFKKPDVNNAVPATVEMYSIAFRDAAATTNKYKWQFFGIPVTSVTASPTFDGSWVRYYDETGVGQFDKWKYVTNGDVLTPFTGYEITQDVGKKIIFQGNLVVGSKTISLPRTSGVYNSGYYILSNSYTAGIEIKNITFTNIEETIYIYNTGSFTDWENHLNTSGTAPGQYWSVPKNTAPALYPAISSMQGFMIKPIGASGPGSIQYKYESTLR